MEKKSVFEENLHKIDRIKDELMSIAMRLEEAGNVRKANSLGTIIARLEAWEHTSK